MAEFVYLLFASCVSRLGGLLVGRFGLGGFGPGGCGLCGIRTLSANLLGSWLITH